MYDDTMNSYKYTLGTAVTSMAERDVGIDNQLVGSVVVGVPDAVAHCLNLS